jgi:primosomal protein N' (replication factor Y)
MNTERFADIILPVAVKGRFTYLIPENLQGQIRTGTRVMVPFGHRNQYTGIVCDVHDRQPSVKNLRPIASVTDLVPSVNDRQLKLWLWMSDYYLCSEGEIMKAALLSEASLSKYRPKTETFIMLSKDYSKEDLNETLDRLSRAPRQQELLSAFIRMTGFPHDKNISMVRKQELLSEAGSSASIADALIAKGIFRTFISEVKGQGEEVSAIEQLRTLSPAQTDAYNSIKTQFSKNDIVLLHGVTSSGKTEIYIHLIEEQLQKGKQVLYMLPEIALTTQIIQRLKRHFGNRTGVYHSRLSDHERVEIWKKVVALDAEGYRLVLGVRSSLFLPFHDLGLVIVDEEHDGSYKQHDPAPRYHARDSAIMLAALHTAKTLLGSASPSVESYSNAMSGKYGLAKLTERFGLIRLPDIVVANTREAYRKKLMVSHFTPELLDIMDEALGNEEQIILFQNRRGFSSYIECSECGWIPVCTQCAVNLTYHRSIGKLVCHYCGFRTDLPSKCGNCHSGGLTTRGFGTEKIEDEIKIVFPAARVARMDQDTTRGQNSFSRLIREFEERKIDILIGTQMISKGLDFENLTVVGILNADNMLNFPDFRAHERSFQLMEQVSGRAGRRQKQGSVIIQTADPENKIIRLVLRHDYEGLFRMQAEERKAFNYPPFCRLIRISLKHKDRTLLNHFSEILGNDLKRIFGKRVLGPEFPLISQIQSWYIKNILIKIEREKPPAKAKQLITGSLERLKGEKGAASLRISVDVDPY